MFGFPDEEYGTHGKYRLVAELGQGGTANVYLAVARGPSGFNKLVVLKFLKPELAGESEFRRMFLNEARLAARLNHPNVVQTYEVFEEIGRPIIVMEYLEGASLSKIVSRARNEGQPIPLAMHLRIISEALNGLHYSHELRDYDGTPLGVVHRDMTPQNVFVSFDGQISLLDFGIAKLTGSIAETQTGVMKGKLRYMPPEQILGEIVDRRTDIFAVGVMLWEAVAREKMWRGISDAAVMYNIVNGVLPSPRTLRPDVPEQLERICMKALASDPRNRYTTAAELQADLEDWLAEHTVTNRRIGQFVSSVFREERAKTRELIERQLAHFEATGANHKPLDEPIALINHRTPTGYGPPSDAPHATSVRPPRSRAWWIALPVLLTAGALLSRNVVKPRTNASPRRDERPVTHEAISPSQATAPAAPEAPAAGPALAPRAEVQPIGLKVSAWPEKARLYLDDQPLASNPFSGTVSSDAGEHWIRAEAPGYATEKKLITFDKDVELALTLVPGRPVMRPKGPARRPSPESAPPPPARATQGHGLAASPEAAIPAEQKINCDPPYFIDENGIRRLKAKCLASMNP